MTTKEQILDAAVNAFGLGPENQEEALAFAMKVEDILDAAKGSEPVAMNLEDEARVWMEHNGMMWKGLAVSTRSTSDHELIDMPALCARFARHVLENTPAPSVSAGDNAKNDFRERLTKYLNKP